MEFIKKYIKILFILFLIIVFVGIVTLKFYLKHNEKISNDNKIEEIKIKDNVNEDKKDASEKVYVDIKGAVKKPGVYEFDNNKRVIDVVEGAGGLTDNADTTYTNLAKKLSNEMVIMIYTRDQIKEAKKKETFSIVNEDTCTCPKITNDACISDTSNKNNSSKSSSKSNSKNSANNKSSDNKSDGATSDLININTASLDELKSLTGIGEGKAQAIIDYREENGNYASIEDILNVSGIGEALYEKIKNNITV